MQDTFWNMQFPKKKIFQIFSDAKERCTDWYVDRLHGWQRKPTELSWERIMEIFMECKSPHVVFIHRVNFEDRLEIGFCTLSGYDEIEDGIHLGDYFLWIHVELEHLQYFIDAYDLKVMTR